MKKLLLSSALLAVCSMSAMDHGKVISFKFATPEDDLTPIMQKGLQVYLAMTDRLQVPDERKAQLKEMQTHAAGYIQAMVNSGNPKWPLILVYEEKDECEQVGLSSFEILDSPENSIAMHMTPLLRPDLYAQVGPVALAMLRNRFPNLQSIVTALSVNGASAPDSTLRILVEKQGFKPCDDYTPNKQLLWNSEGWVTFKKSLVEEEPKAE
jgi:hypothetical protein